MEDSLTVFGLLVLFSLLQSWIEALFQGNPFVIALTVLGLAAPIFWGFAQGWTEGSDADATGSDHSQEL